jgi:hypothetical protein
MTWETEAVRYNKESEEGWSRGRRRPEQTLKAMIAEDFREHDFI